MKSFRLVTWRAHTRSVQTGGSTRCPITRVLWPLNVRVFDQSGVPSRSQRRQRLQIKCLTSIHPPQTIHPIPAGLISACTDFNTHLTSAQTDQWITVTSEGFTFFSSGQPVAQGKGVCVGAFWRRNTATYKEYIVELNEGERRQVRWKCYLTESQESWQPWREVYREWWDQVLTRTTRGQGTLWKVRDHHQLLPRSQRNSASTVLEVVNNQAKTQLPYTSKMASDV